MPLGTQQVEAALRATGEALADGSIEKPVRILLVGGTAGMLGGLLKGSRTTGDVDVMETTPEDAYEAVAQAARSVAEAMGLPERWLNRDCQTYAWCMALGWESRCIEVGVFGPLVVLRASRLDLIASKVVSLLQRPQDLEDLRDMRPTADELGFAERHLDRLANESLDGETFEAQRAVIEELRGGT